MDVIQETFEKLSAAYGVTVEHLHQLVNLGVEDVNGKKVVCALSQKTRLPLISPRAGEVYVTPEAAVAEALGADPDTGQQHQTDRKCGLPRELFDGLNPTAKLTAARKAGVVAPPSRRAFKRAATVQEQDAMKDMSAVERVQFARAQGICS